MHGDEVLGICIPVVAQQHAIPFNLQVNATSKSQAEVKIRAHLSGGHSDRRDKDLVSREISHLSRCGSASEVAKVPASSCFLQACKRLPSNMTVQLAVVTAEKRAVALPWCRPSLRVVYLGVQVAN